MVDKVKTRSSFSELVADEEVCQYIRSVAIDAIKYASAQYDPWNSVSTEFGWNAYSFTFRELSKLLRRVGGKPNQARHYIELEGRYSEKIGFHIAKGTKDEGGFTVYRKGEWTRALVEYERLKGDLDQGILMPEFAKQIDRTHFWIIYEYWKAPNNEQYLTVYIAHPTDLVKDGTYFITAESKIIFDGRIDAIPAPVKQEPGEEVAGFEIEEIAPEESFDESQET